MSASILGTDAIDLLVTALTNPAITTPTTDRDRAILSLNPHDLGQLLTTENHRSYDYRYPTAAATATATAAEPSYHWNPVADLATSNPAPLHLVHLDKTRRCYEYQSCEHPTWRASDAHALARLLQRNIATALADWPTVPVQWDPRRSDYLGDDNAPWEWTRAHGLPTQ